MSKEIFIWILFSRINLWIILYRTDVWMTHDDPFFVHFHRSGPYWRIKIILIDDIILMIISCILNDQIIGTWIYSAQWNTIISENIFHHIKYKRPVTIDRHFYVHELLVADLSFAKEPDIQLFLRISGWNSTNVDRMTIDGGSTGISWATAPLNILSNRGKFRSLQFDSCNGIHITVRAIKEWTYLSITSRTSLRVCKARMTTAIKTIWTVWRPVTNRPYGIGPWIHRQVSGLPVPWLSSGIIVGKYPVKSFDGWKTYINDFRSISNWSMWIWNRYQASTTFRLTWTGHVQIGSQTVGIWSSDLEGITKICLSDGCICCIWCLWDLDGNITLFNS